MTAWLRKLWDNRKLRKRHKELRVTVRELLAFDDDILSDDVKEQYRALQTEIRQTSKTDARNIEILEKKLDKRNFRKKALCTEGLIELDEYTKSSSKRPARLYTFESIKLNSKRAHFISKKKEKK